MSFFKRPEDTIRTSPSLGAGAHPASHTTAETLPDNQTFGSVFEESQQFSKELLTGVDSLKGHLTALLGAHNERLSELGLLRTDYARINSLLEYESSTRIRLDEEKSRLTADNKGMKSENIRLRNDLETTLENVAKLQAVYSVASDELAITQSRLRDTERELIDKIGLYEETSGVFKRTQQELDARSRDLAAVREKLDLEKTAHQILAETSGKEIIALTREVDRLNEERSQLRAALSEQESAVRTLQAGVIGLRQELAVSEDRAKRFETELESLQTSSALEVSQLTAKCDAANSKAELVEKILATARSRNKVSEEELQTARSEIKRVKSELSTTAARLERIETELSRTRTDANTAETSRRGINAEHSELLVRFKDSEALREKNARDFEASRRELLDNATLDREEMNQLRTSLEIAKSEIRQMTAEKSILIGQLEMARSNQPKMPQATMFGLNDEQTSEIGSGTNAATRPIYDISEKSLRAPSSPSGYSTTGDYAADPLETGRHPILPAE